MLQAPRKGIVIVHNNKAKACANFLSGLIGEIPIEDYDINAAVVDAKKYAAYPPERKHAKLKVVYIGKTPESKEMANSISKWKFDKFGIRYGWHGTKAVIMIERELSDSEFREMAKFAEKEISDYELDMRKYVKKRGTNPFKQTEGKFAGGFSFAALGGAFAGKLAHAPLIGKIAAMVGAAVATKAVVVIAAAAAVGSIVTIAAKKDKLDPRQIREQQYKFAVTHFYLKSITEFLGIANDEDA